MTSCNLNIKVKFTFLFVFLLFSLSPVFCQNKEIQELYDKFDSEYGLNTLLFNGCKYFGPVPGNIGNPFYMSTNALPAKIYLNDYSFENVHIKYELEQQIIILEYESYGTTNYLIIPNSKIDSVRLNDQLFIANPYKEIKTPFIQEIYSDSISVYFSLSKVTEFKSVGTTPGNYYSKLLTKKYLVISNNVYQFNKKRSFLIQFSTVHQNIIKDYLKFNELNFNRLSPDQLKHLIIYCNTKF